MSRVNVIYHHYPHYRRPILRELTLNGRHDYRFWGSLGAVEGINSFTGDDAVTVHPLRFRRRGRIWILKDYWPAVLDPLAHVLIILGNPNMPASWIMALAGRMLGKKVLFWSHGWLKPEPFLKRVLRNVYFRLANTVLVYGERARDIGAVSGYPKERIATIFNSLDFDHAQEVLRKIDEGSMPPTTLPQALFVNPERPLIICTARLTRLCRFDLLFTAAATLESQGTAVNILLVGDGPEQGSLEALAKELSLDVHFFGACYDEDILGALLYHSDLTVSPGKIGLTVIHSLTYGTPAITHNNLDQQMPEVEAIEPGGTGSLFRQEDPEDLAEKIEAWLRSGRHRDEVRRLCQEVVARNWNPTRQRELIDAAVDHNVAVLEAEK